MFETCMKQFRNFLWIFKISSLCGCWFCPSYTHNPYSSGTSQSTPKWLDTCRSNHVITDIFDIAPSGFRIQRQFFQSLFANIILPRMHHCSSNAHVNQMDVSKRKVESPLSSFTAVAPFLGFHLEKSGTGWVKRVNCTCFWMFHCWERLIVVGVCMVREK